MKPLVSTSAKLAWLVSLALAALVLAQWQVNPQSGRVDTRVNNRVGGELYGNMGSVKYAAYQTRLLPSEERYATWRSGALPSEVALGAAAAGPLSPNGVINYLPPPNAVQQAGRAPTPQLYNPAYRIDDRVDQGPMPQAGYGTIKYAPQSTALRADQMPIPLISGAAPSAQLPTAQLPTGQITGQVKPITPPPVSSQINYPARPASPGMMLLSPDPQPMGSIRYASPGAPATQPATAPLR